ncbi:MAG: hypothetical protein CMJ31_05615 [Phycisphaerae bacterium]|nr:hypothetical protein [Phycisphaerae bacterium]
MNYRYPTPAEGSRDNELKSTASSAPSLALLVTTNPDLAAQLGPSLREIGAVLSHAESTRDAERLADEIDHDLILVDADIPAGGALPLVRRHADAGARVCLVSSRTLGAALAVDAVRAGAVDAIDISGDVDVVQRLRAAARPQDAAPAASAERLSDLCKRLNDVREEFTGSVGGLCADLLGAYKGLSTQLDDVAMASELNSLLRQELDVESLLRTVLEFLLARVGSTNAGIFLPNQSGEYSLGAYINYDLPRDSTDLVLEELVHVLAPAFEDDRRVARFDTEADLEARLGPDAHWVGDRSLLAVACHDEHADGEEPECLAVIALFRKQHTGFSERDVRTLQIASDLFAQQLGRVIRVHHRHLPEDDWGLLSDENDAL